MTAKQFRKWYTRILKKLYPQRNAGFVILLVSFPLLERYIRCRTGSTSADGFKQKEKEELLKLFPSLQTISYAGDFWEAFRHGLLHQITFFAETRKGQILKIAEVSHDIPEAILLDDQNRILIHPVLFAQRVLGAIEDDFESFSMVSELQPLPEVKVPREWHPITSEAQFIPLTGTALPELPSRIKP